MVFEVQGGQLMNTLRGVSIADEGAISARGIILLSIANVALSALMGVVQPSEGGEKLPSWQ